MMAFELASLTALDVVTAMGWFLPREFKLLIPDLPLFPPVEERWVGGLWPSLHMGLRLVVPQMGFLGCPEAQGVPGCPGRPCHPWLLTSWGALEAVWSLGSSVALFALWSRRSLWAWLAPTYGRVPWAGP